MADTIRTSPSGRRMVRRLRPDRVRSASEDPGLLTTLLAFLPNWVPWQHVTPPIYTEDDYEWVEA